jgi:hypothetical protein
MSVSRGPAASSLRSKVRTSVVPATPEYRSWATAISASPTTTTRTDDLSASEPVKTVKARLPRSASHARSASLSRPVRSCKVKLGDGEAPVVTRKGMRGGVDYIVNGSVLDSPITAACSPRMSRSGAQAPGGQSGQGLGKGVLARWVIWTSSQTRWPNPLPHPLAILSTSSNNVFIDFGERLYRLRCVALRPRTKSRPDIPGAGRGDVVTYHMKELAGDPPRSVSTPEVKFRMIEEEKPRTCGAP